MLEGVKIIGKRLKQGKREYWGGYNANLNRVVSEEFTKWFRGEGTRRVEEIMEIYEEVQVKGIVLLGVFEWRNAPCT